MSTKAALLGLLLVLGLCSAAAAQDAPPMAFEVEALNSGLPPAPPEVDRSTPRATVAGLLAAAEADRLSDAAHYLNFADLSDRDDPEAAAVIAGHLAVVLERAVTIDWHRLTDRPDGALDTVSTDHPLAGQARRSILLGRVELPRRSVPVRVNRVLPSGGEPVWVFSSGTVALVPALYDRYGPSELERALPDPLRRETALGLMWWEWLALPLGLALMGGVAWTVWHLVGRMAIGDRRGARLLRATRAPLSLLAATALASWMIGSFFAFSSEISHIAEPLIALGLALAALLFVLRAADIVLEDLVSFDDETLRAPEEDHRRILATRISAGRRALLILIVVVAMVVGVHEAQLAGGLGLSFLASAGLLTLVFGFAARTVLGNILASMQIALNQSARIGDKVMFDNRLCHVERLNFTYVQLRVWTGVRLIVPVSEFVSEPFENWTLQDRPMKRLIALRLSNDANIDDLREDFEEILDSLDPEQLDDRDGAFVMVTDHDVLGKEVTFGLPCSNPDTAWAMSCEAREKLIAAATRRAQKGESVFAEAGATEAA